jgi:hypothetical protein
VILRLKWVLITGAFLSAVCAHLWQSVDLPYRQLTGEAYGLYAVTTLPSAIIAEIEYKGLLSKEKRQIFQAEEHQSSAPSSSGPVLEVNDVRPTP